MMAKIEDIRDTVMKLFEDEIERNNPLYYCPLCGKEVSYINEDTLQTLECGNPSCPMIRYGIDTQKIN